MTQDTTPARAVADGDPALAARDIPAQPQQAFETPGPAEIEECRDEPTLGRQVTT